MSTCAFVPCDQVTECCLVGGCITKRFGKAPTRNAQLELRKNTSNPTRNGINPTRASRDPRFIKRKRKALR